MSFYLCLLSFGICYWFGRRSLLSGIIAVLAIGYLYGVTRANVPETFSHFIFDAGVIGLYATQLFRPLNVHQQYKIGPLKPWLEFLIAWPLLLFLLPIQDFLIQFVGLRGNIFFLPFILFGARLSNEERYRLALWIAAFNVLVLPIAGIQYFFSLEIFFPRNPVTELIYLSHDVMGYTAYRIPATFANAHSYGGTMTITLPLLLGAIVQKHKSNFRLQLLVMGVAAALLGLLMSAVRLHSLVAGVLIVVATFSLRSKFGYVLTWLILIFSIGWLVSGEQRMQRFMELRDTEMVAERISWSVNMNFFEIAAQYPFGNGLGGGGTSIPYFLRGRIHNPVTMENEYARIVLEEGIMGLVIWIIFIGWLLTRPLDSRHDPWYLGRRLAWVACIAFFANGLLGIGLFTSVPQTCLSLMLVGWVGSRQSRLERTQALARYQGGPAPAAARQYS
jgi:hypothetical protein